MCQSICTYNFLKVYLLHKTCPVIHIDIQHIKDTTFINRCFLNMEIGSPKFKECQCWDCVYLGNKLRSLWKKGDKKLLYMVFVSTVGM